MKFFVSYRCILRKTIEGYLDSVPSLTFNTIKTKLLMDAFHSSRYLQSKMDASFQSHFNGFSTVQIQMVQPSIPKSHTRSNMIEIHFYRSYSIMTGTKIIAGSPSNVWHLILQLLSVFSANLLSYWHGCVISVHFC